MFSTSQGLTIYCQRRTKRNELRRRDERSSLFISAFPTHHRIRRRLISSISSSDGSGSISVFLNTASSFRPSPGREVTEQASFGNFRWRFPTSPRNSSDRFQSSSYPSSIKTHCPEEASFENVLGEQGLNDETNQKTESSSRDPRGHSLSGYTIGTLPSLEFESAFVANERETI